MYYYILLRNVAFVIPSQQNTPSGSLFTESCPLAHSAQVHNKVKMAIESVLGQAVHCTTDIWTSKLSTNAYLPLRGHCAMQSGRQVL